MKKTDIWLPVAGVVALLVTAACIGWVWHKAGRKDASRSPAGLAQRFMHVKSQAMAELRTGLASGDFRRMEAAVGRLSSAGRAASWYLSDRQYGNAGDVFRQTVDQLGRDLGGRDLKAAQETYVRLTASCNACHQRNPSGEQPAEPGAAAATDSPVAEDEPSDEGNAFGPTTSQRSMQAK